MKYEVTYKCGHTATVQLFGKGSDREWRLNNMKASLCPECWKKQQLEKAVKESEGLPELIGSEKQVAWAMSIRLRFVQSKDILTPEKVKENISKRDLTQLSKDKYKELLRHFEWYENNYNAFINETSSKFWIEIRNEPSQSIFSRMCERENAWDDMVTIDGYIFK